MNLRELREAAGLSVGEAAEAAGVSTSTVTRSERGRLVGGYREPANLPLVTVTALLRAYGKTQLADVLDAAPSALRATREREGITRQELADEAEAPGIMTARAVQAIELGTRRPTAEQTACLVGYFGASNEGAQRVAKLLTELVQPVERHGNKRVTK